MLLDNETKIKHMDKIKELFKARKFEIIIQYYDYNLDTINVNDILTLTNVIQRIDKNCIRKIIYH